MNKELIRELAELADWEIVEFEVQVKQLIDIVDKKKIWDLLKK